MTDSFGLIPISPLTLKAGVPVGVNLYDWHNSSSSPILLAAADIALEQEDVVRLSANPTRPLYIDRCQRDSYQKYLREEFRDFSHNTDLSDASKFAILSEVVRGVLADAFQRNNTVEIVNKSQILGRHIAGIVGNSAFTAGELNKILQHDYGTFTHSTNVAFYSAMLASKLGFSGDELSEIAAGGLVHDIGKLEIDERIINKPGKLDEFEMRIMRTHPTIGLRRLTELEGMSRTQLMMAYQHHERIDGRGYPVGCTDEEIALEAKICSVADVFEAMTSHRPYRAALSIDTTLDVMQADAGLSFDPEVFRCWNNLVRQNLTR